MCIDSDKDKRLQLENVVSKFFWSNFFSIFVLFPSVHRYIIGSDLHRRCSDFFSFYFRFRTLIDPAYAAETKFIFYLFTFFDLRLFNALPLCRLSLLLNIERSAESAICCESHDGLYSIEYFYRTEFHIKFAIKIQWCSSSWLLTFCIYR